MLRGPPVQKQFLLLLERHGEVEAMKWYTRVAGLEAVLSGQQSVWVPSVHRVRLAIPTLQKLQRLLTSEGNNPCLFSKATYLEGAMHQGLATIN